MCSKKQRDNGIMKIRNWNDNDIVLIVVQEKQVISKYVLKAMKKYFNSSKINSC